MSTRVYQVRAPGGALVCWGLSRYGEKDDLEMEESVAKRHVCGETSYYITFTPERKRQMKADVIWRGRVRRMRQRAMAKCPLFADAVIESRLAETDFQYGEIVKQQNERAELERQYIEAWWAEHTEEKRVRLQVEKQETVR